MVMLFQRQILEQGDAVDVVEDSHKQLSGDKKRFLEKLQEINFARNPHQLDDSPDGDDQAAERQFWPANRHRFNALRRHLTWEI